MKSMILAVIVYWGMVLSPATLTAAEVPCLAADSAAANDANQLAAIRAEVETQCPCAAFDGSKRKTHRDYTFCVKDVIRAALGASELRLPCRRIAMYSAGRSICGYPAKQSRRPCIHSTEGGTITCSIKGPKHCGSARSQRCEARTSCLSAADTNRDGMLSSADSGACKPHDCAAQNALYQTRVDNWVIACFDTCTDPLTYQECIIGCAAGANPIWEALGSEDVICNANPLASCDELHASMLQWCADNPDFVIKCDQQCFHDFTCESKCHLVANCVRAADEYYAYCVETF